MKKVKWIFVFAALLLIHTSLFTQVLEQDSLALVALYESTDGDNWTDYTNWLAGPVSTWFGITVTGNRVTKIDLQENHLQGEIPSEIGNLTALTRMYLIDNEISGAIPTSMSNLIQLQVLHLNENQLTGSIPPQLGNLTNLTGLNLGENQLTETIPTEIWNLTKLNYLALYSNQLSGSIPPEVSNLTNLQILTISNNQFESLIPSEIGTLSSLEYIDLFGNQFSGALPDEMINLTSLKNLNIFSNQFTDLPDLSSISTLVVLTIQNNQFTFEDIEPHVGIATFSYTPQDSVGQSLDTLVTTGSTLKLSVSVGGENNQYQWYKGDTPISGANDSTLTILPVQMSDEGVYFSKITNTVATALTLYSKVIHVNVTLAGMDKDSLALIAFYNSTGGPDWTNNTNWLNGPVSEWYGITVKDNRVSEIDLHSNNLIGTIPPEIGNLDSLERLKLWANSLTDTLPAELYFLTNLGDLRIQNNQLTGSIPDSLHHLKNLFYLGLSSNNLTGSIPASIGNLTKLGVIDLSSNDLSGPIPSEIGDLTELLYLDLSFNEFNGSIPPEIGNLTQLQQIILAGNQLSGPIPPEIGNLTMLENLLLYYNHLEGPIPSEIGNLVLCEILELEVNQLSGSIPTTMGNMVNLQNLRLWANELEGPIPGALGKLSNLTRMELSRNQLTGDVPDSLTLLTNLTELYLDENCLTGLPNLSGMVQLTDLHIQENQFTFEDIEPNINISNFVYTPQDSIGEAQDTTVQEGENLTFSIDVDGTANTYQWMKNDVDITGADSSVLSLLSITKTDTGVYICKITNSIATDLTLYSKPIHIKLKTGVYVNNTTDILPKRYRLHQNHPNPFNPKTEIAYDIPQPADVKLSVFNTRGQKVKVLFKGHQQAGSYSATWDGKDAQGRSVASGIYIFQLRTEENVQSIKALLIE